jgi:hypothetical protein
MLAIFDHRRSSRREFLRIGGGLLGGLMACATGARGARGAELAHLLTGRSVVFLFLHGGPSQIETFDPKMTAPGGICSVNGEVSTKLPGVTFGSSFPKLASLADRFSVVRSFQTGDGNHDIKPVVGKATSGANLGSLYARVAGQNRPVSGVPTNVMLFPQAAVPEAKPGITSFGDFQSAGFLGSGFAPFTPSSGGAMQDNLKLKLPIDRLDDRRSLLTGLDQLRQGLDRSGLGSGVDAIRQQAFDTLLGGVAEAFDFRKESPETIARYDTAPLVRPDQISRKWNNYDHYVDNASSLGKLLLLSRRLCERGCGFVTVTTSFVWDMHSDVNNAGVEEGMRYMGLPLDYAVSAFLEDVRDRGLSDKIMLVVSGEMGRTPRINERGGRDHWGGLAPLLISGGGFPAGQVLGQSDRQAAEPLTTPVRIPNLVSTIMHRLIDVPQLRLVPGMPRELLSAAVDAEPIEELV